MAEERTPSKYDDAYTPADERRKFEPFQRAGGSGGGPGGGPSLFPLRFIPPVDADEFVCQDETDSAAAEIVVFDAPTAQLIVPQNYYGVITEVSFFATNADATLEGSAFGIQVDDALLQGWGTVRIPQVGGTQFVGSEKTFIKLLSNQRLTVRWVNSLGGAHHVGFFLHGWVWPMSSGGQS